MKILLAVDGTELSLHETRFALRLVSEGLRAQFVLVNAQAPATLYELVTARDNAAVIGGMQQEVGADMLAPSRALLDAAGVAYETAVAAGEPAKTLIGLAQQYGCDLIVLGSRSQGLLRAAIGGSVARTVVEDAPVPVLLVKEPDAILSEV